MALNDVRTAPLDYARSALRRGQAAQAIAALSHLTNSGQVTPEIQELLGVAHTMAGNASAARAAFQQALTLDRSRASAHYNYALFLMAQNELDEAAEENDAALYLSPQHAGALNLRKQLSQKLFDRRYVSEEGFAAVGNGGDRIKSPSEQWAKLECPMCGGKNFITARTCSRCGGLLPEIDEIIPIE
jgi:tetratricopeptide (TPR) repeat protein